MQSVPGFLLIRKRSACAFNLRLFLILVNKSDAKENDWGCTHFTELNFPLSPLCTKTSEKGVRSIRVLVWL